MLFAHSEEVCTLNNIQLIRTAFEKAFLIKIERDCLVKECLSDGRFAVALKSDMIFEYFQRKQKRFRV